MPISWPENKKKLYLGNLDAKRDWGFAPEYVVCQWLMLQQDKPDDYVIGTGESHSVREFVELAFNHAGVEIEWDGDGAGEKGIIRSLSSTLTSTLNVGDVLIEIAPRYFRPVEVEHLLADASKARERLGWEPKVTFKELVKIMVDADMEMMGLKFSGEGNSILEQKGINWTKNQMSTVK